MKRIVVDASAVGDLLLRPDQAVQIKEALRTAGAELHAPELIDIEVASAFRKALHAGELSESRLDAALADYFDLNLVRHRHKFLVSRVLQLRYNFSPYDATYVALAEQLDASLLTADEALARAVRQYSNLPVLP